MQSGVMPEGNMAVINPYFSPAQSPFHLQQRSLDDYSNLGAGADALDRDQPVNDDDFAGLSASKSVESLDTLLSYLPDIVIPEPLYNPLPLQCLAANALPEAVRIEIERVRDQVLWECSAMTTTSPKRNQDGSDGDASSSGSGSSSARSAESREDQASSGIRGDQRRGSLGADHDGQEDQAIAEDSSSTEPTRGDKSVVSTAEVSLGDYKK